MPELNEMLDNLAADVTATTRAPGATAAIGRARRRRRGAIAAAVAGVAIVTVGGGLAIGSPGGDDQQSPIATPSSPETTASPAVEPSLASGLDPKSPRFEDEWRAAVRTALSLDPGWGLVDSDPLFLHDCLTNWAPGAGMSAGSFGGVSPSETPSLWHEGLFFDSPALASDAFNRLDELLQDCETSEWQIESIGQTGALLASSADGVAWVLLHDAQISSLQAPTSDGPPSPTVQAEVSDLLRLWASTN